MESLYYRCGACGGINRVLPDRVHHEPRCGNCSSCLDLHVHPLDVDDGGLERLIQSAPLPVLAVLWSSTDPSCRLLGPVLSGVTERHSGRLMVARVNTARFDRLLKDLKVTRLPWFGLYQDGALLGRHMGPLNERQLEAFLAPKLFVN